MLIRRLQGCNYFHVVETSTFLESNRLGVPFTADDSGRLSARASASAGSHASAWARADDEGEGEEMITAREALGEPAGEEEEGRWRTVPPQTQPQTQGYSWQLGIPTRVTTTTTTSRLGPSDTALAEPDVPEAGAGSYAGSGSGSMAAQARLLETRRAASAWEEALPIVRAYNGSVTPWRNGERLAPWSISIRRSMGEERVSAPARRSTSKEETDESDSPRRVRRGISLACAGMRRVSPLALAALSPRSPRAAADSYSA